MNTLLEVKHKLKTQDLFRASTVKAMVEQCETLTAENAALRERVETLEAGADKLVPAFAEQADTIAALREKVQRLEAALKQTATQLHGVGIARITTNYHFGNDFHKCTNGWCMEAAAALEGAK